MAYGNDYMSPRQVRSSSLWEVSTWPKEGSSESHFMQDRKACAQMLEEATCRMARTAAKRSLRPRPPPVDQLFWGSFVGSAGATSISPATLSGALQYTSTCASPCMPTPASLIT